MDNNAQTQSKSKFSSNSVNKNQTKSLTSTEEFMKK